MDDSRQNIIDIIDMYVWRQLYRGNLDDAAIKKIVEMAMKDGVAVKFKSKNLHQSIMILDGNDTHNISYLIINNEIVCKLQRELREAKLKELND